MKYTLFRVSKITSFFTAQENTIHKEIYNLCIKKYKYTSHFLTNY